MRAQIDVAIVGAGPAGLAAARELARAGADVEVLEREREAGGTPRHCAHQGFGLRDLHRALSGPAYGARLTDLAMTAGAEIAVGTQVTGWAGDGVLALTGSRGPRTLQARAVLLATGCRERPRAARLIPGSRPRGVFTTGTLQRLVAAGAIPVGRRAVVVGAEHVSYSALETLRHGGARAVAISTELARSQTFAPVSVAARLALRVPLRTRTAIAAIHGRDRVDGVDLLDLVSGSREHVECDTVVLTADWIPERELAQSGGVTLDPGTMGPRVDGSGRTDRPGVFAAGNVTHGAEAADIAALEGRAVAGPILALLSGAPWPDGVTPVEVASPLAWIVPNALAFAPGAHLKVRAMTPVRGGGVELEQDGRVIARARTGRLAPGRAGRLSASWASAASDNGLPVTVRLASRVGRGRRQ